MKLLAAVLCGSIQPPSGVRGANLVGITDTVRSLVPFPATVGFAYFIAIDMEGREPGTLVRGVVDLVDPDAKEVCELGVYEHPIPVPRVAGREEVLVFAANVRVTVPAPGPYAVRLAVDGQRMGERSLYVRSRDER